MFEDSLLKAFFSKRVVGAVEIVIDTRCNALKTIEAYLIRVNAKLDGMEGNN